MLLNPCVIQQSKYSFLVKDVQTQQTYDNASVDLSNATGGTIVFKDLYTGNTYSIDISSNWSYLLGDGVTINISDFPSLQMGDYTYFPDWFYEVTVQYTYSGTSYSVARQVGFRKIISYKVFQQLQQSDWIQELKCGCGCEKYSTSFRKFDFLNSLEIASDNCLINQYTDILKALYRLTGTRHEYDQ